MKHWEQRIYEQYASNSTLFQGETAEKRFAPLAPYLNWLIKNHCPSNKDIHILDIACGQGEMLYFFKKNGYKNLRGIDISPQQVAVAHQLGIFEIQLGDVFTTQNIWEQPSDLILLFDILEHLSKEQIFSLLDSCFKNLNKGGKILLHVPNAEGIFGMSIRYGDFTHQQAFTTFSCKQILQTIGFQDITYFEEKPIIHNFTSFIRYCIWQLGTFPIRILRAAESGSFNQILSQNLLLIAHK